MENTVKKSDDGFRFAFLSFVPGIIRFPLIVILLAAGLACQLFFRQFFPGLVLLLLGTAFGMIRTFHSEPVLKPGEPEWNPVTPDEYNKAELRILQLRSWDRDLFDVTNPLGRIALIILVVGALQFLKVVPKELQVILLADLLVIIAPLWLTGTRTFFEGNDLLVKIQALKEVLPAINANTSVQLKLMLGTRETADGKRVPADARLVVSPVGAPKDFYGIQVQASVNRVKDRKYPYVYCVLLAKAGSGILAGSHVDLHALLPPGGNTVMELDVTPEVELIVVRQYADKNGGYFTSARDSVRLLNHAYGLAVKLLGMR
ncbi:MAG: hypothetical protein PHW69_08545 [Elusimicrobiaceae bacterium]|nr:hypothetical protein [Elusimicrobiaceae bacterium]